jgi:hypothetical protein
LNPDRCSWNDLSTARSLRMNPVRRVFDVIVLFVVLGSAAGCIDRSEETPPAEQGAPSDAPAARHAAIPFRLYPVIDEQQGGLVVATITAPEAWKVTSKIVWNYADVSHPVRGAARVESPDGSAWVEYFPIELFYWLEPVTSPVPIGTRSLGMIHKPNIKAREALERFVVAPYRGKQEGLEIVDIRSANGLAAAFGSEVVGQALAARLRYVVDGAPVDEEVFALLGDGNRVPYTGPQGTWYESHRPLVLAHAIGAKNGQLESMRPLLGFIATSLKVDPAWEAHRQRVVDQLAVEFNRMIANGYAQIQAAAQLSRAISANNDALLASMETQRQAQAQREAARRQQAQAQSTNSGFSDYVRGVERMQDPYWGESEQSYNQRYHWTDGHGNYRSSNDSGYDPNIGAGGGPTWQRMEPVD